MTKRTTKARWWISSSEEMAVSAVSARTCSSNTRGVSERSPGHHCQHVAQILVLRLTIAVRPHEHVLRGETGVVHRRRARQHALDALQVERLRRTGRVSSDAGVAGITGIAGRASIGCAGNYA